MNMSFYRYDLHIHTTASDGGYPPAELVALASAAGMRAIAFTDHDTVASNSNCMSLGEKYGLRVIPGVELSTLEDYHILGYFLQPGESELTAYLSSLRERSWAFIRSALKSLARDRGVTVSEEELARRTGAGIPNMTHLVDLLFQRGDLKEIAFDSPSTIDFFGDQEYLTKYFQEFARTRPFNDAADVVRLILSAGGVPVWAHPWRVDRAEIIRLKKAGLKGLEVVTPKHDEQTRLRLFEACSEFGLIPTGGTDFHGRYFDSIEKGRRIGTCGVGPEIVNRLEECALEIEKNR